MRKRSLFNTLSFPQPCFSARGLNSRVVAGALKELGFGQLDMLCGIGVADGCRDVRRVDALVLNDFDILV